MNEVILELAALLLSLFCLLYSLRGRARKAESAEKGLDYAYLPASLLLCAAASLGLTLAQSARAEALTRALNVGWQALHSLFFLCLALYALFLFLDGGLTRLEGWGGALCFAVVLTGVAVQLIWGVRVELFFDAVACFGILALFEQERDGSDGFRRGATAALALVFLAVIVMNVTLILRFTTRQSNEIGDVQLDVIRGDLEDTLAEAKTRVLRVAIRAEQLLEAGADRGELAAYFEAQRESFLSDENFMNVYIGGPGWHVIPHFDAPESFHANERVWYLGAKEHPGELYITEPYLDADTGTMYITVSLLLADGETVVGMDLNFTKAQESIARMTRGTDRSAMIVTAGGLIVGYSDMTLVGERAADRLPEYAQVLERVMASSEHRSFRATLDGKSRVIFSAETGNNWYLILSVGADTLYAESYRQMLMLVSVNVLMLAVVAVYCLLSARSRRRADRAFAGSGRYLSSLGDKLRQSAAQIQRLSDWSLIRESSNPGEVIGQLWDYGQELAQLADSVHSFSETLRARGHERQRTRRGHTSSAPSRRARNGILVTLCVALLVVLFFSVRVSSAWGSSRINREADACERHLGEWVTQQESILNMFADVIAAEPALMEDYPAAVRLLNEVAAHYPEIAACYLANPYAAHPVIMSTGWEPGEEYRPETRPWYREAERSTEGYIISDPYYDVQSGTYCITFSRVVFSAKSEFLGVFGVDYYLDELVSVLGEHYTSTSYAFLVDADGTIINHPNAAYQLSEDAGVFALDTEYAPAIESGKIMVLRDYAGHLVTCLSRGTDSGFTVVVVNRWGSIFGSAAAEVAIILALFGVCIAVIILLLNRLIRWQEEVNQRLVEAAETAVNAGKAKSQFLAQMSHEIRTPMNAIIGLDNIALRDPELPPRTREQLEKIGASAQHLLALINDILDMSRIESGRMVLKEEDFSFEELLEQITVIINGQCADKGLVFTCNLIGQPEERYVGDDLKLKQVLINILGNAVKFTDAPGTVSFTVEQPESEGEQRTLRFTIRDTGVGMDKDFIPKLFEAFSQEDATNTNRYGGSGLGMAITKSMVEMMGGNIQVESEKGVGSTFTVTVKLKAAPGNAAAALTETGESAPEEVSLAGRHLLVAEDIELNAEILLDLLELEDISAEWAEDGKRALELFSSSEPGHFDAVLMDMRMPVMDGLAATRAIRALERPDAKSVPIIALTANAFEENVQTCLEAGMNAHLSKPVDSDLLMATLRKLIGK